MNLQNHGMAELEALKLELQRFQEAKNRRHSYEITEKRQL